jgi:IS5 family transposase
VSLAVTHKEGFVVGIQPFPGNPFDGHTLGGQLDQVERLTGQLPAMTSVDRGYKGCGVPEERSRVLISGTRKLGCALKRHLRRWSAIEPEIRHMQGDAINAFLCGAGHNLRKILARLRALLYLLPTKSEIGDYSKCHRGEHEPTGHICLLWKSPG